MATGEVIRTIQAHSDRINSVAFSPDGIRLLSGSGDFFGAKDRTLKLWDTVSGRLIRSFEGHSGRVTAVAFSPDGTSLISGSYDKTLKLWDAESGVAIRTFIGHTTEVTAVAFSPDGTHLLSGSKGGGLWLWDVAGGQPIRGFEGLSGEVFASAFSPDGRFVLAGAWDGLKLWETASAPLVRTFGGHSDPVLCVAGSPDGMRIVSGGHGDTLRVWDAASGQLIHNVNSGPVRYAVFSPDGARLLTSGDTLKLWDAVNWVLIRTFERRSSVVSNSALSPDGTRVISGENDQLIVWDVASGNQILSVRAHAGGVWPVAFSPDGTRVVSGGRDNTLKLWDVATGQLIRTFEGHSWDITAVAFSLDGRLVLSGSLDRLLRLWDIASGKVIAHFSHDDMVQSVAIAPDGRHLLSGGGRTLKLWDISTGQLVRTLEGHQASVFSTAFSAKGSRVFSGGWDGTVRLWNPSTGELLASLFGARGGQWLAMTPDGFFATSRGGTDLLAIVRGVDAFSVMQFYDVLYRPDLVQEQLKGDPEGKHKDAAFNRRLEKILASGPAPQIEHLSKKTERAGGTVRLAVRIVDVGGGIGPRVAWRVNGQTQGNVEPAALNGAQTPLAGRAVTLTESLRIDPSEVNTIELTAYNGAALLATPPLRITVDKFGATTGERSRMHVLAIGVDKYRMADLELKYAVKDTLEFSKALEAVGSGLFAKVQSTVLANEQVRETAIAAAFDRISADARTDDVFVLFLAGHGKSIEGRYYYYPQTLDFRAGQTVERHGIGQDKWQAWLAKVGHVQKSVLILDTCESGAAAGLVRGADSTRQTAMDQFQHATGHNLIAAARQAAFEGYRGHGVLTYALLEALHKKDGGGNDSVRVGSLADHIGGRVPAITQELFGQLQSPIRRLSGNDFPIGIRQAVLEANDTIPKTPTHFLVRSERVRERPAADAQGGRELPAGFQVRVVEYEGGWAVIARDGQRLGYVPVEALLKTQ